MWCNHKITLWVYYLVFYLVYSFSKITYGGDDTRYPKFTGFESSPFVALELEHSAPLSDRK